MDALFTNVQLSPAQVAAGATGCLAVAGATPTNTFGTAAQMIATTPALGQLWTATDLNYTEWIGKANPAGGTYWAPRGGRQLVYSRRASKGSPLATLTGVTSGQFALPGGNIAIPGKVVTPGCMNVRNEIRFTRTGAAAIANIINRLGSTGSNSTDNSLATMVLTATNNADLWLCGAAIATSNTTFTSTGAVPYGNGNGTFANDRTASIDFTQPMYVSVDINSANASDSFAIWEILVWLEG